jgi:RNase P subunit RPR2
MGKNGNGGKGKAPDAATRMNYLYQAAHSVLDSTEKDKKTKKSNQVVAAYYTQLMVGIGHKAVQRSSKEVKRTICKGCRGLLLPGQTAKVVFTAKHKKVGSICLLCKTKKIFPLNHISSKKNLS